MRTLLTSFFAFLKKEKFPTKENIIEIKDHPFSAYKAVLLLSILLTVSLFLALLMNISSRFSVEAPDYGGKLSFGVIGSPRFINPLLSSSDTDQALTYLVYNGLVSDNGDGTLLPVLADHFVVSPDGKEYQFILKNNLSFSNKTPLTSSDVAFTFETKKQLALLADPTSTWVNISINTPDSKTVVIKTSGDKYTLPEKLSLGIIPKALWESIPLEGIKDSTLNIDPIGSGPFRISNLKYTNTVPEEVILKRNLFFSGTKPYIRKINIHIFANQLDLKTGLLDGDVDSTNLLSGAYIDEEIAKDFTIAKTPTEKNVSLFILQSAKGGTTEPALKQISKSIDRNKIVAIIENGYGFPLENSLGNATTDEVISELTKLGYKKNESNVLTKSGSVIQTAIVVKKDEQLLQTAQLLSQELSSYGIANELKVFDQGLFTDQANQKIYPFILGTESDVPTGYETLIPLYTKIIPLISESYIHAPPLPQMRSRAEIFKNIEHWYVRTDKVWKIFN